MGAGPGSSERLDAFYRALAELATGGVRGVVSRRRRVSYAVRILRRSGLFDGRDYARRHPEVEASGLSPAEHFLTVGYAAGLQARARQGGPRPSGQRREKPGRDAPAAPATADTHQGGPGPLRPTNIGPAFDDAVAHAVSRFRPPGESADYDLVRAEFDAAHYLLQSPGLIGADVDLVEHFMKHGVRTNRSPSPDFSMSTYLARQPDAGSAAVNPFVRWVTAGRAAGEVADPTARTDKLAPMLGLTEPELVATLADVRTDLTERLRHGRLGAVWAAAARIEPLLGAAWPETTRPKIQPAPVAVTVDQMAVMYACHGEAGHRLARVVLVVGGTKDARDRAGRLARALATVVDPSEIVWVLTDSQAGDGSADKDGLPAGVRSVDFATASAGLRRDLAQQVLAEMLRTYRAASIVAVGSPLLVETLRAFGKALTASESIHLWLSPETDGAWGHVDAEYLRHYYRFADILASVIVDDAATADRIADHYQLGDEARARIRPLPDLEAADLTNLARSVRA